MSGVDASLLALLVCPVCDGEFVDVSEGLACLACRRVFPVEDGVPILLPSRSRKLPEDRGRRGR